MLSCENLNCIGTCLLGSSAQIDRLPHKCIIYKHAALRGDKQQCHSPHTSFLLLPSPNSFRKPSGKTRPSALTNPLLLSPSELPKAVTEQLLSVRPALLFSLRAVMAGTASRLCWTSSLTCHHLRLQDVKKLAETTTNTLKNSLNTESLWYICLIVQCFVHR